MDDSTKRILYIIGSFFLGIVLTISFYKYYPEKEEATVKNDVTCVNVTESNSLSDSIGKVKEGVVVVQTYNNNSLYSTGTGFIYKTDDNYGYIITNHHVIADGYSYKIINSNKEEIEATVLGSDEYSDIAVLRIDKKYVTQTLTKGAAADINIGDTVFTLGSPLGADYMGTVTKGILSGKDRMVEVSLSTGDYYMQVLQTDAAVNPGNSGGPLFNINGEVVGVISMKLSDQAIEGMGFAIPIEYVMSSVKYLEEGKTIERPYLGVSMIDASNAYMLYYYGIKLKGNVSQGVYISDVEKNSVAEKYGLKKGDIILEIDGKKITSIAYFRYYLYNYAKGDEAKFTVYYDDTNEIKDITIKF